MNTLKSIHKYLCKPISTNIYEYFITSIIVIALHDLLN